MQVGSSILFPRTGWVPVYLESICEALVNRQCALYWKGTHVGEPGDQDANRVSRLENLIHLNRFKLTLTISNLRVNRKMVKNHKDLKIIREWSGKITEEETVNLQSEPLIGWVKHIEPIRTVNVFLDAIAAHLTLCGGSATPLPEPRIRVLRQKCPGILAEGGDTKKRPGNERRAVSQVSLDTDIHTTAVTRVSSLEQTNPPSGDTDIRRLKGCLH